jgi:hypothetical protein
VGWGGVVCVCVSVCVCVCVSVAAVGSRCRVTPQTRQTSSQDGELQTIFVRLSVLQLSPRKRFKTLTHWPRKDLGHPAPVRNVAQTACLLPSTVDIAGLKKSAIRLPSHSTHRRETSPTRQEAVARRWQRPRKDLGHPALVHIVVPHTCAFYVNLIAGLQNSALRLPSHSTHRRETSPTRQQEAVRGGANRYASHHGWKQNRPPETDPRRWQLVAPVRMPLSGREVYYA